MTERATQNRVVKLFQEQLGYTYLGNWEDREGNGNIEEPELRKYLDGKYSQELINKGVFALKKESHINSSDDLYTINKEVYNLLRYGTAKRVDAMSHPETIHFIDWKNPLKNNFAIAEEVSLKDGAKERRPDIVLYINGIAIGVLELKRTSVSVSQGIRQSISNQSHLFNKHFFTTIQLVLAGNDSNGLYYGTTGTEEKYFLKWKEDNDTYNPDENILDKHLLQFCKPERLLEIIHDFLIFDYGVKKLCRPNQYFGIKEAQKYLGRNEGGIIWHTQGSGKSLTMVWLAKWILENKPTARLLIITDRTELDEQIEGVFSGVGETIVRTKSGADLIDKLNHTSPRLLCSLIHKFGGKEDDTTEFIEDLKLPKDFIAKGDFVVFIDECHRTQSGDLHNAMKGLLPSNSIFIGFTGTPLLKKDKKKSLEIFGSYIHTYKFDEAVKDGVVLDLLYEARDIDQHTTDQKGIDEWFEIITQGMNPLPKAELKQQWGTLQKVLSSKSRIEKVVFDIKKDFLTKPRLKSGRGNAMLVARSIYEACRYYDIFQSSGFKKCAIITSFTPTESTIKLEDTGSEGDTEKKEQFEIYQRMLKDYGFTDTETFEKFAKDKFKKEPANMKLLIVVDKLLTGFDAVSCSYLYIDKQMRDHGLFQAICRTNRLGKEEEGDAFYKEFGYIVDYQDLFENLNKSISDYTSDAFDAFDEEDVKGLLTDRLVKAKERLTDAIDALHELCLPVPPPKNQQQYFHFFCGDPANQDDLKEREEKRLTFYKLVVSLIRAYNNIAPEIIEAGYTEAEAEKIKEKVKYYTELRDAVKNYSGDYIDLKQYEPDMRQLLDMYITADPSKILSNFGDATLLQLIVDNGIEAATDGLPESIKKNIGSMSETIENNMRKTIIQEMPINPAYYEKMSVLLLELIRLRKEGAIAYEELLKQYEELAKKINPKSKKNYPTNIDSKTKQVLFDNLSQNEDLAIELDKTILDTKDDDWRNNHFKKRKIQIAIRVVLSEYGITDETEVSRIFDIVNNQHEY